MAAYELASGDCACIVAHDRCTVLRSCCSLLLIPADITLPRTRFCTVSCGLVQHSHTLSACRQEQPRDRSVLWVSKTAGTVLLTWLCRITNGVSAITVSDSSNLALLQLHLLLCRWMFSLNPRLSWEEVSKETKQRLRLLPKEAVRPQSPFMLVSIA